MSVLVETPAVGTTACFFEELRRMGAPATVSPSKTVYRRVLNTGSNGDDDIPEMHLLRSIGTSIDSIDKKDICEWVYRFSILCNELQYRGHQAYGVWYT